MIEVTTKAKYNGKDMDWTEALTGSKVSDGGEVFYHFSDKKIKSFAPVETCFFSEKQSFGHVYKYVAPEGKKLSEYSSETRIKLTEGETLKYIGKIQLKKDYTASWPYPEVIIDTTKGE